MNTEMIAKRHWKWATNALKAANRDAASRDPQNAVSRAYYAMMHAANAALATKGSAPASRWPVGSEVDCTQLLTAPIMGTRRLRLDLGGRCGSRSRVAAADVVRLQLERSGVTGVASWVRSKTARPVEEAWSHRARLA